MKRILLANELNGIVSRFGFSSTASLQVESGTSYRLRVRDAKPAKEACPSSEHVTAIRSRTDQQQIKSVHFTFLNKIICRPARAYERLNSTSSQSHVTPSVASSAQVRLRPPWAGACPPVSQVLLTALVFQSEEAELVLGAVAGCKTLFCGLLEEERLFRGALPGGAGEEVQEEEAMMGECRPVGALHYHRHRVASHTATLTQ